MTGQSVSDHVNSVWAADVDKVQYTNWFNKRQARIHKHLALDFEDLADRDRAALNLIDSIPPSNDPIGWYITLVQMYHQLFAEHWQIKANREWELSYYYTSIPSLEPQIVFNGWWNLYDLTTCEK